MNSKPTASNSSRLEGSASARRTAPVSCIVAIGGNQGDVPATIEHAKELLNSRGDARVLQSSSMFRTAAVGSAAGNDFCNAAWEVETTLSPLGLLAELQQLENLLGRTRSTHWGPRTLDLDLVLYGNESLLVEHSVANDAGETLLDSQTRTGSQSQDKSPKAFWNGPLLVVPHPACWYRRFVLDPVVQIAGERRHPVLGDTLSALLATINAKPFVVQLCGTDIQTLSDVQSHLLRSFMDIECGIFDISRDQQPSLSDPNALHQLTRSAGPFDSNAAVTLFLNELTPNVAARCDSWLMRYAALPETADERMCELLAAGVSVAEFPAALAYAQIPTARRIARPIGINPCEFAANVLDAAGCSRRPVD